MRGSHLDVFWKSFKKVKTVHLWEGSIWISFENVLKKNKVKTVHLWEGANDVSVHLEEHRCLCLEIEVKNAHFIFWNIVWSHLFSWQFQHFYFPPNLWYIYLLHGNINRPKPGSVHPEEADKVRPVVHHGDVHLSKTWLTCFLLLYIFIFVTICLRFENHDL